MSRSGTKEAAHYVVGYGRPPSHSRFRKGQSGNPAGRRKYTDTARGEQLVRLEADRLVTIREGDKVRRMRALQAALRRLFIDAVKGHGPALRIAIRMMQDFGLQQPESSSLKVSWLPSRDPGHADEVTRIERVIVDSYPGKESMTESERTEFERLLEKAKRSS